MVRLINLNQIVEIQISGTNKNYYQYFGYNDIKTRNAIYVPIAILHDGARVKVDVNCDICKKHNFISYRDYVRNTKNNYGQYICHSCSVQVRHNKKIKDRQDDYYNRLLKKCTQNGYKLLSSQEEFLCNTSYVRYECPIHGEQQMRIANFLSDRHCPKCAYVDRREKYQLSKDDICNRVIECGGSILNPDDYINNSTLNLLFECQKCGGVFVSSLQRFLQHGGQLCKYCSGSESVGEFRIRNYLEENCIQFCQEYWFDDCRDIKPLPFDFYLPDNNTIIEFDGRQHFDETNYFSYSYEKTKQHDAIKSNYCSTNNIKLIRIPYTKINQIDEILENELVT